MYRLIASDMDGTLLTTDKIITERNLSAIKRAVEKGCMFCLSTGRTMTGIKRYLGQLELTSPVIAANGAVVAMPDGEVIYEIGMSPESARTIYKYALELDLTLCVWSKERLYINRKDKYTDHYKKVIGIEAEFIGNFEDLVSDGILKIIWYADDERMPELHSFLGENCPADTRWANSTSRMIEFNDVRVSKATAMLCLGEKFGIKKEEMIAIGDNFNDLPMLEQAGMPVAMGNAPDEVKAQAAYVTDTNDNDGVAKAIERLVLSPLGSMIEEKISEGADEINLPGGRFEEKLHIEASCLRLYGNGTVISYDDYARKPFEGDELYGTFRSYSAYFGAKLLYMENLTIENTAGKGEDVGQAVAAYFDCRRAHIKNCVFKGWQDTIFTAPLPEKPVIPNSFKGPNDGKGREPSLLYFENCCIEGDVDFIFGGACAIFENCEIRSLRRGYVAAPSTPKEQKYGYIFRNCRFTGEGESYIARPWRKDGACIVIDCELGEHIHPDLWNDWESEEKRENCRFYADTDKGAPFGRVLTEDEKQRAEQYINDVRVMFRAWKFLHNQL